MPADLEGLRLRVPNNPRWVDFFGAMGAAPTPMTFAEVYNALQPGVVDGQENPVNAPVSARLVIQGSLGPMSILVLAIIALVLFPVLTPGPIRRLSLSERGSGVRSRGHRLPGDRGRPDRSPDGP